MRFPLHVSSVSKLPNISLDDCLQRKLSLTDLNPPYRFNCLLALSFHLQLPRFEIVTYRLKRKEGMNCRIGGLGVVSVEVRRYTRSYHFTPYFPFKDIISRRENDRMLTKNTARVNRCALSFFSVSTSRDGGQSLAISSAERPAMSAPAKSPSFIFRAVANFSNRSFS